MVKSQNIADAEAGARQHIGQGHQAVKQAPSRHFSPLHIIGKQHGEQSARQRDHQGVLHTAQQRGGIVLQQLLQILGGKGVAAFAELEKAGKKNTAILQNHHNKEQQAHPGGQQARGTAAAQLQGELRLCPPSVPRQQVCLTHQVPVQEKRGDGGQQQEHIHSGGLFQIGVAYQLQVDLRCDGGEAAADDHWRAEVRQGANKGQQQGYPDTGAEQREHHVPQNGPGPGAQVPCRLKTAGIQLGQHTGEKQGVQRDEGDTLHPDDAPAVVGIPGQAQQPVRDPAPASVELNIGQGGHKGRRDHGHQQQPHAQQLCPAFPCGEKQRGGRGQDGAENRGERSHKNAVPQIDAVLAPHRFIGGQAESLAAPQAAHEDAQNGIQHEQAHRAQQRHQQEFVHALPANAKKGIL